MLSRTPFNALGSLHEVCDLRRDRGSEEGGNRRERSLRGIRRALGKHSMAVTPGGAQRRNSSDAMDLTEPFGTHCAGPSPTSLMASICTAYLQCRIKGGLANATFSARSRVPGVQASQCAGLRCRNRVPVAGRILKDHDLPC